MGDRTDVTICFREKDKNTVEKVFSYEADEYIKGENDVVESFWYDVNSGALDEQEKMVELGVVFEGNHDAGSEYMPMAFAHDGHTFAEVCVDLDGHTVCRVSNGEPDEEEIASVRKYEKVLANVQSIFGEAKEDGKKRIA